MSTQSGKYSQAGNSSTTKRGDSSRSSSDKQQQSSIAKTSGKQNIFRKNTAPLTNKSPIGLSDARADDGLKKVEVNQANNNKRDLSESLNSKSIVSLRRPSITKRGTSSKLADIELATSTSGGTALASKSTVDSTVTSPASSSGNSVGAGTAVSSAADSETSPGSGGMQSQGVANKNKRRRYDLKLDLGSAHRATGSGNPFALPASTTNSNFPGGNTVTFPGGTTLLKSVTPSGLPTAFLTNSGGTFAVTPNATFSGGATLVSPISGGVPVVLTSPDLDKFGLTSPQIHQFILHSELPTSRVGGPSLQSILFPHYNPVNTAAPPTTSTNAGNTVKQERATFVVPAAYAAVRPQAPVNNATFEAGERFSNGFVVELDKLKQKDQQPDQKNSITATLVTTAPGNSLDVGGGGNTTPSTPTMVYLPAGSFIQSNNTGGSSLTFQSNPMHGTATLLPVYSTNSIHGMMPGGSTTTVSAFNTVNGGNITYIQSTTSGGADSASSSIAATASSSGGRATKNNKKNAATTKTQQQPAAAAAKSGTASKKQPASSKRSSSNLLQLPMQSANFLDSKHSGHSDTTSEASGSTNKYNDDDDDDDDDENEPSQTGGVGSSGNHVDKVERKRERNRLAAAKCRARKIDRIVELEKKVQDINDINVKLELQRDSLSEEVRALRDRLREHESAGCMIEQYTTN